MLSGLLLSMLALARTVGMLSWASCCGQVAVGMLCEWDCGHVGVGLCALWASVKCGRE